jgi:organic hydroperoxide reductase OsmC/OhrA
MGALPHRYSATATGSADGDIALETGQVPTLQSAPPLEFGGPGTRWSPETLIVAAVGDCFLLTFRAVAQASKFPWTLLRCEVHGTLDRVERVLQFTRFDLRAHLEVPLGVDADLAQRVLQKAERNCLISNSLKAASHLETFVRVGSTEPEPALSQP